MQWLGCSELTTGGYYGMYLTALIIDGVIARVYRHNGAMNKSVKLRPGTTEWNQTCYRDYTRLQRRVFGKRLLQRRDSYVFGCFELL